MDANGGENSNTETGTDAGPDAGSDAEASPAPDTGSSSGNSSNANAGARADVDVDLTALSSTIAQAEYNNISRKPTDYIGKTIRVSGAYFSLYLAETDQRYHIVTIVYGDECCRQGFEFRLSDEYTYPDDYPAENEVIEVVGVLDLYESNGLRYLYLAVGEITVLNR